MKLKLATFGAVLAAFAATAGGAFASNPVQATGQSSTTEQGAIAASSAAQVQPTNAAYSVRVLSPGSDGAVSQANDATSSAVAANLAGTQQDASQTQAAGCGCNSSGLQSTVQGAETGQLSGVLSGASQLAAANQADPASVGSTGTGGTSGQANDASSTAGAANLAGTGQSSTQSGGGTQSAIQSASTGQAAGAASSATQYDPSNSNTSVRVLSPGDNGSVQQSNDASSHATAVNAAGTTQDATQDPSGSGVQSATQSADTQQLAEAKSQAVQVDPSNSNISVRVLSPGSDGAVKQSNDASSSAVAANLAGTTQNATQDQSSGCGCSSSPAGVQSAIQSASTGQAAGAESSATQYDPSNSNISVRVLSPGDDGNVTQSNDESSSATALDAAGTGQDATQDSSGSGTQSAIQSADTQQLAGAKSQTAQVDPSNSNYSVRVLSPGDDGNVDQSNDASSNAVAANLAGTTQDATQDPDSVACGCGQKSSPLVQAIGQDSSTDQASGAVSGTAQFGASNTSDPVRIGSYGNGGSLSQSNDVSSQAAALNGAFTSQDADQTASAGNCGCGGGDPGVQAIGQYADTGQLGVAESGALQVGASNSSDPVRIGSDGSDGRVSQSNDASSAAIAANLGLTGQSATQMQSGSGIQALGQEAVTLQGAKATSFAAQLPVESSCGCSRGTFGNSYEPVRIASNGDGGSVHQSNDAVSGALAANGAFTSQTGSQTQGASRCGCSGLGIQALGQQAETGQFGDANSQAWQFGAANAVRPTLIWSGGNEGSTRQSNLAWSGAFAPNLAWTSQTGAQQQ